MKKNILKFKIKQNEEKIKNFINDYNIHNDVITVDLSKCNIYQPYSNQMLLDNNIYDYINQIYQVFNLKKINMSINIKYPDDMVLEEKNKIHNLLKIHYAAMFHEDTNNIKRTNKKSLILLFVGAIFLFLYSILQYNNYNFIYCSIVEIFSWVFVWESCNCFFLVNTSNRISRIKNLTIYNSIKK